MPIDNEFIPYRVKGSKNIYSFHKESAAGKTLAEFQEHEKHVGLTDAQLKEVWQLARGTKEADEVKEGFVETPVITDDTTKESGKGKNK